MVKKYFFVIFLHYPQIGQMLEEKNRRNPKLTSSEQLVVHILLTILIMLACFGMYAAMMEERERHFNRLNFNSEKTFYLDIL
jgi:hypothetical protein